MMQFRLKFGVCVFTVGSASVLLAGCGDPSEYGTAGENEAAQVQGLSSSSPSAAPADAKREAERVRAFLDSRYTAKDVRHSFHTKFGETIDCIDFFAQPGVRELAAAGTPITELPAPSVQPKIPEELRDVFFTGTPDDEGQPRACPRDAVPVLRITPERIRDAGGLDAFQQAHHKSGGQTHVRDGEVNPPGGNSANYAHSQQYYNGADRIAGGKATVNIQKSVVILPGDHSIMQTWLVDNSGGTVETVETGVNVDPSIYGLGNFNPHFFIFATSNNYGNGCYNNSGKSCLRWIGAPGATLTPGMTLASSTFNGTQKELSLQTLSGDYGYGASGWNIIGAGVYPSTDFPSGNGTAATFGVGGEVYDATASWYVPMGSGAEPMAGYGQAAYWVSPESQGLGVLNMIGNWNYTSFQDPWSERAGYYGTNWSGGRVYVGPLQGSFYSNNYGYQWSAIGDWAVGRYKAQCDYKAGVPLKGVASRTDGSATQSILCGDYVQMGSGSQCNSRNFSAGDNRGESDAGWDWDPGYVKGECNYMEVASGIAQTTGHKLDTILCCAESGNLDRVSCSVENFSSSNSASYGSGPDWAIGLYKGVCPVGKAVVGISRKSSGAPHAILCCHMM